jgi:ribosomal protein S18 acetylase RimI-like enzyme
MLEIREMRGSDYAAALKLWRRVPELGVSPAFDNEARIAAYLDRNPGLSSVALLDGELVGTVLCGHDGRRGSFYHVGVAPEHRGNGIAAQMLKRSYAMLLEQGIDTAFLFVYSGDPAANAFWQANGWQPAPGITYYSRSLG